MDNGRLQAILGQEIDDAIGMLDSDTTAERAKALDYYLRRPMGTEIEGRSQIVTAEVAEAAMGGGGVSQTILEEPSVPRVDQAHKQCIRLCRQC